MADFDFRKNSTDVRVLMIAFTEGAPLEVREFATVLRALDSDYREMTGRGLILGRAEIGSTWAWVYDALAAVGGVAAGAADVAKAIDDITTFGLKLTGAFKPSKSVLQQTHLREVEKTVKAVAKVAKKHDSVVQLRKAVSTERGTETIEINITPTEAYIAKQRLDQLSSRHETVKALPVQQNANLLEEIRKLPPVTGDTELVIMTLIKALSPSGNIHALIEVADTLAKEGRWDLAEIIRRHIGDGPGLLRIEN